MREAFKNLLDEFSVSREEWLRGHPGEEHPADVEATARREVFLIPPPKKKSKDLPIESEVFDSELDSEFQTSPPLSLVCPKCNGTRWIMVGMDAIPCLACEGKVAT